MYLTLAGRVKMTNSFFDDCKELILLSNLIQRKKFNSSFIQYFKSKAQALNQRCSADVDVNILQRLQTKLLEPLKFQLKASERSSDKCLLIECLIEVIKLTPISDVCEFYDLYTFLFFQIFKDENSSSQLSEELKLAVLECCTLILKHSTVLEEIYAEEYGAKFSLGISVSVNLVKQERSIKIRLASLDFLLRASQFDKKATYNEGLYEKIGDLFALYLPGIAAPLLEVILRDETQHHLITAKALTCWGHVICLVLSDFKKNQIVAESEMMKEWQVMFKNTRDEIPDLREALKGNKRTKNWLEAAAIAIQPLVVKISEVRKHSHPECRLELTCIMVKLLEHCSVNLKNCLTSVIEVLVSSMYDDDKKVREVAENALTKLEAESKRKNVKIFVSMMEENLHCLIIKLPQIIQSGNEELLLPSLKSLSGYLKILAKLNRLEHLISLSSVLKKIVLVIQIGFELEIYPEISNQDFLICDYETNPNAWSKPWKRFKHFMDQSIKIQLEKICNDLGRFGPPEALFDFLLDAYIKESRHKNELLLIINEIVSGSKELLSHVVRQLLDFYLDPTNLYPSLQVDEVCSLVESRNNIIKVALVMEGLGKLAKNLGNRFEDCLLSTLFYVLERMGSPYAIIKEAATTTATEISKACGLNGNINLLIAGNVDYLTYQLTIKLKRKDAAVFDVATVLLKNSLFETLPHLEDIVNVVLKSSSENMDSPHTVSYLRLMQTFVHSVNKWMSGKKPAVGNASGTENEVDRLVRYLKSCRRDFQEEEVEEEMIEDEISEEPQAPPLPKHIEMTLSVSNHCLHYLPSRDRDKKILVLDILNESVRILADREDELLPLVHKIWSPLVARFDQITDPLIINRSFALLCTLAHTSKHFIRSRTLKNVLPALRSFLLKESPKSKLKDSSSGYFFTQNFKLQKQLLDNLGILASSLELFEKQTDLIAESALPYLSRFQPKELQDKSKKLFEDLKTYDPYLVHLKLQDLKNDPEFSSNVSHILNLNNKNTI